MATQTNYDGENSKVGQIARAHPFLLSHGKVQVDANERMPRPGDAVIWDSANHAFKIPSSSELRNAVGIVTLDGGAIPTRVGSTTNTAVQYPDGSNITVMVQGVIGVRVVTSASQTINFGAKMVWKIPSGIDVESDWEQIATAAFGGTNPASTQSTVNALLGVQVHAFNTDQVGNSTTTVIPVRVNI